MSVWFLDARPHESHILLFVSSPPTQPKYPFSSTLFAMAFIMRQNEGEQSVFENQSSSMVWPGLTTMTPNL